MNKEGYVLDWSEEFDYTGRLDESKWTYETGNHQWANNELQAYTDRETNVCVKDGKMIITALKEKDGEREYTSGRVTTYGKKSFKYGYIEVKAKIPKGAGSWPAIWLLACDIKTGTRWPLCGEIDIMEHVGRLHEDIYFSLHSEKHNHTRYDTKQYSTNINIPGITEGFHTYAIEWTEEYVEYFVDDISYCKYCKTDDAEDRTEKAWPYDKPYYLIINIAVGGGFGGKVDDSTLPYTMEVEYVHYYKKK